MLFTVRYVVALQCPVNTLVQDGQACKNGESFCYHGECHAYSNQCRHIWGEGELYLLTHN